MMQVVITTKEMKFMNIELTSNPKLISINKNKF